MLTDPFRGLPKNDVLPPPLSGGSSDILRLAFSSVAAGALSLSLPLLVGHVFETIIPQGQQEMLPQVSLALLSAVVVIVILNFSGRRAGLRIGVRHSDHASRHIWKHLLELPLHFFRKFGPVEAGSRAHAACEEPREAAKQLALLFPAAAIVITNLGLMVFLNAGFAIGAFCLALVLTGLTILFSVHRGKTLQKESEGRDYLKGMTMDWIRGISKIRMAGAESEILSQWRMHFQNLILSGAGADDDKLSLQVFRSAFSGLSLAGLFVMAASVHTPAGSFLALFSAYGAMMAGVLVILDSWWRQVHINALAEAARPVLETPSESADKSGDPGDLTGRVEIQNLSFRYDNQTPWVLNRLSATIQPGEFVALAGPSGCGKSSLLRLILGLEAPNSGKILLDGHDQAFLDPARFRSQIGIVFQNPVLFAGNLYENICGESQKPADAVWEAAELAGIADDIRRLPLQLHTMVGRNGDNFSSGQRQRIAIARALLLRPTILLLDEATSALDIRMQTQILETLGKLCMTRILVTHRLSALRKAGRILMIHDGTVTESGSCDDLVRRRGDFFKLVEKQIFSEG